MEKILIVGNNALVDSLAAQANAIGKDVDRITYASAIQHLDSYDEFILLSDSTGATDADTQTIKFLNVIAEGVAESTKRPRVHLMLSSIEALHLCRSAEFNDELKSRLDIYPFALADEWARKVRIDYKPITLQSEHFAHLVIFGSSNNAEAIAINAALSSHFPNYTRNPKLRTRITMIGREDDFKRFINRYKELFDNSFYRIIDTNDSESPVSVIHRPLREDGTGNFVDVEWEFVVGDYMSPLVYDKVKYWSEDPERVLTIALTDGTSNATLLNKALTLPDSVKANRVPVYVWFDDSAVYDSMAKNDDTAHIIPIGMADSGYDLSLPLVEMGKTVNYIYNCCYNDNISIIESDERATPVFTVDIDMEKRDDLWQSLPVTKRMSSIYNAMSIPGKLRSVGMGTEEIDRFHDLSMREIKLLSEVEHNRWCVEELILGYRPCTSKEAIEIGGDLKLKDAYRQRKIHYDLRPYRDLRNDITGKNVEIYDICLTACLPLIAKTTPLKK